MDKLTRMKILTTGVTTSAPANIKTGELAYSYVIGSQADNGDRLYIGAGTEIEGLAPNVHIIGGKYFTDLLSHVHGTTMASSALIVDVNSHISNINASNLRLGSSGANGQIVTSISTDDTLIDAAHSELVTAAAIKAYVDEATISADFTFAGDTGTPGSIDIASETFLVSGTADQIVTSSDGQTITIELTEDVTIPRDLVVQRNAVIEGDMTVLGTTTTIHSEEVVIRDPIFGIGGLDDYTTDDMLDRGVQFKYFNGGPKLGFFGYDDSTGRLAFVPEAVNTGNVISGDLGDIDLKGAYIGTTRTGIAAANVIDTVSGDLVLDSFTGNVVVNDTLQADNLILVNPLEVSSGGTGVDTFPSNGVFVSISAGDGLTFVTGVEGDILQFGPTGAPYASTIIDGGEY